MKQFSGDLRRPHDPFLIRLAAVLGCLGLALRIAFVVLAGNRVVGPFSGVGDQIRYMALADSIFHGRGFSYAGQPTALRPPLYPYLLAGFHVVFGSHYPLAVRVLQFLVGVTTAYVCLLLSWNLFGIEAGVMAGAVALTFPTLLFVSTELQTECLAAFLTVLFLFFLLGVVRREGKGSIGLGITSGLATLIRFNCALLPVIGILACLASRRNWRNALLVCLIAGLIISPWIVRNAYVFHGKILFSSHGGINFLEGVLAPTRRAQGESERLRAATGWLHADIEQNTPHRLLFPSEDQLDRQARSAAFDAWRKLNWTSRIRLLASKVIAFWFSTDQFFDTTYFSPAQRKLRAAGVVAYWFVLAFGLIGWVNLLSVSRVSAVVIASYAIFVTSAHLPFVMNTRLRIPFLDPLLAVLAAGGFCFLLRMVRPRATPPRPPT